MNSALLIEHVMQTIQNYVKYVKTTYIHTYLFSYLTVAVNYPYVKLSHRSLNYARANRVYLFITRNQSFKYFIVLYFFPKPRLRFIHTLYPLQDVQLRLR